MKRNREDGDSSPLKKRNKLTVRAYQEVGHWECSTRLGNRQRVPKGMNRNLPIYVVRVEARDKKCTTQYITWTPTEPQVRTLTCVRRKDSSLPPGTHTHSIMRKGRSPFKYRSYKRSKLPPSKTTILTECVDVTKVLCVRARVVCRSACLCVCL